MITPKSPYSLRLRDVPVEHAAVAAYAGKCGIVLRNGDVKDFVAVGGVGLDELGCAGRIEGVAAGWGGGARGVVEADGTVGGAC
jgi:hypothetical protein